MTKKNKKKSNSKKKNQSPTSLTNRVEKRHISRIDVLLIILNAGVAVLVAKGIDIFIPTKVSFEQIPIEQVEITHSFDFGTEVNDSVLNNRLTKLSKIEVIEASIQKRNSSMFNKIILDDPHLNNKGYAMGNSMPYCKTDVLITQDGFIDSYIDFFDSDIVEQIQYIGLKVFRISADDTRTYLLDLNYEPRANNILRISNNLGNGQFEFEIGFSFKKDMNNKYPVFYSQKKRINISKK